MAYEFKNWKTFRDQMKNENIQVAKFEFKYHECDFDIVYSLEQNVFYAAKKGTQIAFSVYLDWYKASVILDKEPYKELITCKNSSYDKNRPYSPMDFLKLLDSKIGTNFTFRKATDNEYFSITKKAIPDEEKIYFLSFRPHTSGKRHVTGTNLAKTRKILGHQIAEFCKSNNVSVAFTNRPSDKSFEMIKNPKKVLDEQND